MRPAEALLQYQRLMQRGRSLEDEVNRLGDRLANDEEVARLSAELEAARAAQQASALRVREIERDVASHRERMKAHEREMMSGRIRNPSDLTRMSSEVDHMRAQLTQEEDDELLAMEQAEEGQQTIRRVQQELEQAQASSASRRADIEGQLPRVEAELKQVRAQAEEVWAEIPAEYRAAYQRLSRLGNPVAEVASGQCGACRVGLTAAELQHVRRGERIVNCQSCTRILVAV